MASPFSGTCVLGVCTLSCMVFSLSLLWPFPFCEEESYCKAKFNSLSIQPYEKCNNKVYSLWYSPICCKLSRPFTCLSRSELRCITITETQLYLLKECSKFISSRNRQIFVLSVHSSLSSALCQQQWLWSGECHVLTGLALTGKVVIFNWDRATVPRGYRWPFLKDGLPNKMVGSWTEKNAILLVEIIGSQQISITLSIMKVKEAEEGIKDEVKELQEESLRKRKRSICSGNRAPRRKNGRQKKLKEEKQRRI